MDKLLNQGSFGFFMGAYPHYSELQLFSAAGIPMRIVIIFLLTRLSNESKIVLTTGADGRPLLQ
ncbi:hypothetical protein Tcan_00416, partial [Toxocara canis]